MSAEAQRCGESARLGPVQKHERERAMVLRLHHEIPGMRIGVGEWIREVRKTADRGQGVEKQAGQHGAGIRRLHWRPDRQFRPGKLYEDQGRPDRIAMTLAREVARKGITVSRQRLLVLRIIDAFGESHERNTRAAQRMVRIGQAR